LGVITAADMRGKAHLSATIEIGSRPSAFDIIQAVLNAVASQYNIPGTIGNKINSAASAGDPWSAELPGSYTGDEAGKMIDDIKKLVAVVKNLVITN
jgi:hypothetical protein